MLQSRPHLRRPQHTYGCSNVMAYPTNAPCNVWQRFHQFSPCRTDAPTDAPTDATSKMAKACLSHADMMYLLSAQRATEWFSASGFDIGNVVYVYSYAYNGRCTWKTQYGYPHPTFELFMLGPPREASCLNTPPRSSRPVGRSGPQGHGSCPRAHTAHVVVSRAPVC